MFENFEQAVNRYLSTNQNLKRILSKFNEEPAIFQGYAPDDEKNWENGCFPRIVFTVDWNAEPNRKSSGILFIDIYSTNQTRIQPNVIADEVIASLSNVFFSTERGVFSCQWLNSENFRVEDSEPQVTILELRFNVLDFPSQRTYLYPDPVPAIKLAIKDIFDGFKIINLDTLPPVFRADSPVIYVRSTGLENAGHDTFVYRPMLFKGAIHVMCTNDRLVRKAIGLIMQRFMLDGEIRLEDGGQLLLTDHNQNVKISYLSNQLVDGQFVIDGEFALTRPRKRGRFKDLKITGDIRYEYERRKENDSGRKEDHKDCD